MNEKKIKVHKINVKPNVKYFIAVTGGRGQFVHCCTMDENGVWIKADHIHGDEICQPYEVSSISKEEAKEIMSSDSSLGYGDLITCRKSLKTDTMLKRNLDDEIVKCENSNQKYEILYVSENDSVELHAFRTSFFAQQDGEEYYDLHHFSLGRNNVIKEKVTMAWSGQRTLVHELTPDDNEFQM